MNSGEEEEWDTQELDCIVDVPQESMNTLENQTISITGLETPQPKMSIGSHQYKIQFDKTVGTDLIFESPNMHGENASFVCATTTKLLASRYLDKS